MLDKDVVLITGGTGSFGKKFTEMILNKYNGHLTQHAHSVYLDPLLSFGIIGLACLVPYIYDNCKRLYKVKEHYSYIALVMGFIGVLLIHCILDYTIFWIHTGLFF